MTASPARVIRLLVVDHSPTARERIRRLFDTVPDIDVVGEAGTIEKALGLLEQSSPTVVLVDCDLPKPGSFSAVKEMMSLYPVPVIMMTKQPEPFDPTLDTQVVETGAVALVAWTPGSTGASRASDSNLIRTVRAMSEVKVVRRRTQLLRTGPDAPEKIASTGTAGPTTASAATEAPSRSTPSRPTPSGVVPRGSAPSGFTPESRIEIVAIGASTGGPPVLQTILGGLSKPFPVPIVLVQHLSRGFQDSLVAWLGDATGFRIVVGEDGMSLEPGIVYLAPDDRHTALDGSGCLVLNDDPPENGSRPSVSVLFRSAARSYGPHAIGVLLTGMGRDGAKELRLMRDLGAVTIAQDEETSIVHGMPGEAIKLKGARYILPPDRMPSVIEHHVLKSLNGSVNVTA